MNARVRRCESLSPPTPEGRRFRCGLPGNHSGPAHTALIPSNAPWFREVPCAECGRLCRPEGHGGTSHGHAGPLCGDCF